MLGDLLWWDLVENLILFSEDSDVSEISSQWITGFFCSVYELADRNLEKEWVWCAGQVVFMASASETIQYIHSSSSYH